MAPRKRKLDALEAPQAFSAYCWKKQDSVALFREDLQHDMLSHIFTSTSFRFTPPSYSNPTIPLFPTDRSWSFAELYLDCLSNSAKANKNLKDKMSESTEYAVNFGKMCLLINVGRINTTLAFYPEMKTLSRTYHPIPSMQLDDFTKRNLQDAPRKKLQLKGCALPQEDQNMPETLVEIVRRGNELAWKPPTCIAHLLFIVFAEHLRITEKYFPEGFVLHDLFMPPTDLKHAIPSDQRAHAFLWLVHHFLERPDQIVTDFMNGDAKLPADQIIILERKDCSSENIDPPEELQFAKDMKDTRETCLEKYRVEDELNGGGVTTGAEDDTSGPENERTPLSQASPPRITAPANGAVAGLDSIKQAPSAANQDPGAGTPIARPTTITPTPAFSSNMFHPVAMVPAARRTLQKRGPYHLARLIATESGVADPYLVAQWSEFARLDRNAGTPLLQLAWQKVKRDLDAHRDPVYDSEEENDWSATELRPRILGFMFRNHRTNTKDMLQYEGAGPDIDPELLAQHANRATSEMRPISSQSSSGLKELSRPSLVQKWIDGDGHDNLKVADDQHSSTMSADGRERAGESELSRLLADVQDGQ